MTWKIPLADMDFGAEETSAVQEVLESRWLTMGAVTRQFEEEFATTLGVRHALGVTNCTAALHMACVVAGFGAGDEVIIPSLTFVATANAVRYVGATPVFADIASSEDLCLSAKAIAKCLNDRSRGIIVMHYGGYACDMPGILALAKEHGLVVIEDAAHAVGGKLNDRSLGTWGQTGCFSFFSNKNLVTGEGGMVVTNDDTIAEQLRIIRSHGMTTLTWDRHHGRALSYDVVALGYNYRIDEVRSAIGRVQLTKLERNNTRRREIVAQYRMLLHGLAPSIEIPFQNHPGLPTGHIMPILLPADIARARFMEQMKSQGIQTSIHFPPVHEFTAYRQDGKSPDLPVTENVAQREVTLPLYPTMTDEQVELVSRAVRTSLKELNA